MSEAPLNFLQLNISLLRQHKPELLAFADTARQSAGFAVIASTDGRPDLEALDPATNIPEVVHDPAHLEGGFSSLLDLLEKEPQGALIFLVGMGLGYEAKFLLNIFPKLRLVILEPNEDLFAAALRETDLTPVLASPKVSLLVGKNIDIGQLLQQEDDALRALPLHLLTQKRLLKLFPDIYQPLYTKLQSELLHFQGRLQTIVKQGPLLFKNTVANTPQLANSVNVQALKNIAQGLPAVCAASGPSLTKNLDLLKGRENQVFIIAVDSAAKILIDHGIIPHLIVTIDPIPASMIKLREVIASHATLPLVWTPEAFPETVRSFQNGPKFMIPGVNDLFRLYLAPLFDQDATFLHMLSVMHAATHLATVAGCNPLIFIGLDLALSGNRDHAEGCPVSWEKVKKQNLLKVPSWDGGEVETIPVLKSQLLAMQSIISQNRDTTFIDATEGGALIPGTEIMPFQEALAKYANKQLAFALIIDKIFQAATKPSGQAAAHAIRELIKAVKASRKTAQGGLKNGKEAYRLWKLAKIPNQKDQALKKFKKPVVASGQAFDKLMDLLQLTNALYPLRAAAHHEFIYARKQFNTSAPDKTPEQRVLEELGLNLHYFESWLATTKAALAIIEPELKKLTGLRTED
jgi:hypothetical protein